MKKLAIAALTMTLLAGCGSTNGVTASKVSISDEASASSVSSKIRSYAIAANKLYFDYADKNADGRVTLQEGSVFGWTGTAFAALDQNGDAEVSLDEFNSFIKPDEQIKSLLKQGAEFVADFNVDSNGKVSLNEYMADVSRTFTIRVEKTVKSQNPNIKQDMFNKHAGKDYMLDKTEMAVLFADIISQGYTFSFGTSGAIAK